MTQTGADDGAQTRDDQIDLDDLQEWGKADPEESPSPGVSRSQRWCVAGFVALIIAALLGPEGLQSTIAVSSNHDQAIFLAAASFSIAAMAGWICFFRRRGDASLIDRVLFLSVSGPVLGLTSYLVSTSVFLRIAQPFDFPKETRRQFELLFPINLDLVNAGNVGSMVELRNVTGKIWLSNADSERLKAGLRKAPPRAFCLVATVQSNGDAMRIMHEPDEQFPPGSVVECPN